MGVELIFWGCSDQQSSALLGLPTRRGCIFLLWPALYSTLFRHFISGGCHLAVHVLQEKVEVVARDICIDVQCVLNRSAISLD